MNEKPNRNGVQMRNSDPPELALGRLNFYTFDLRESYTPYQLALLAASCDGASLEDKLNEAVKLLIAAEKRCSDHDQSEFIIEKKISILVEGAERDTKGRIKLTPFIHQLCKLTGYTSKMGNPFSDNTVTAKFKEWAIHGEHEFSGHSIESLNAKTIEELLPGFVIGDKTKVFSDANIAHGVGCKFVFWYLNQNAEHRNPVSASRSKGGQFASPKNKGSKRGEDGQFKRKSK